MQISDFLVKNTRSYFTQRNLKVFKKVFYNFLEILAKKSLELALFRRDGRVAADIYFLFF